MRSSSTRRSIPLAMRPMSELSTRMPKSTTNSDWSRSGQPVSASMAAGLKLRSMFCQMPSMMPTSRTCAACRAIEPGAAQAVHVALERLRTALRPWWPPSIRPWAKRGGRPMRRQGIGTPG